MCLTRAMPQDGRAQSYAGGGQTAASPFAPDTQKRAAGQALAVDLAESCLSGLEQPAAITGRSLIVKSFGRRRRTKVSEERTRGPVAVCMGF